MAASPLATVLDHCADSHAYSNSSSLHRPHVQYSRCNLNRSSSPTTAEMIKVSVVPSMIFLILNLTGIAQSERLASKLASIFILIVKIITRH